MKKSLMTAAALGAAVSLVALSGCASNDMNKTMETAKTMAMPKAAPVTAVTGSAAAYEAALSAAKAEQKKAAAVGGEWRDTGKVLKKAEEAAAAGDYAKATNLADRARFESEMGQQQAAEQVNVGNPGYLSR